MNHPLETERLLLRPFVEADAEAWHAIWGDPDVIWWGASPSLERSAAGLARLVAVEREQWPDGIGWLAVMEQGSAEIVGDVLLQPAPFVEGVEVGWHVRKHVWNRGYATEAARATIERAFADGVLDEVYAAVALQNAASLRVVAKLGMEPVKEIEHGGMPHHLFVRERATGRGPSA